MCGQGYNHRSIGLVLESETGAGVLKCKNRLRPLRYRVGRDRILDIEVEAKVDHVENSVAPQR